MAANGNYLASVPQDVQDRVRKFFEVYDPERLESSDFNVLLRYIANRGFAALEEKLLKKYGVNVASMEAKKPKKEKSPDAGKSRVEKEPSELDNLPPPPDHVSIKIRQQHQQADKQHFKSIQVAAGISPDGNQFEDPERARVFQRLTDFYQKYNKDKLRQGIGDVVEYVLKKGEDKLNAKLRNTYGEDLKSFEKSRANKWRQSAQMEMTQMLEEEKNVGKMDPERQRLRQELIEFFMAVEPARAELKMDPLLNYAENHGIDKLNQKLFDKYGYSLAAKPPAEPVITPAVPELEQFHTAAPIANFSTSRPGMEPPVPGSSGFQLVSKVAQHDSQKFDPELKTLRKGDLPDYVRLMLGRYYAKYDQVMLEEGGVDAVYEWTRRNGLEKLNTKLQSRYGQSLQEFIQMANELRDDLIEFYRHRDKNKLVTGIQAILDWGLRNGRAALNEKLKSKYGVGLDPDADIYGEVMESASQF